MRVGFLHVALPGRSQLGLTRYGRLLAAEARRRPELEVVEAEALLDGSRAANAARLRGAGQALRGADVVHVQYSRFLWLGGWQQRYYWRVFRQACPRPMIATLHDVYPYFYPIEGWRAALRDSGAQLRAAGGPAQRARNALGVLKNYAFDNWALRALAGEARALLVCTAEEQRRAAHLAPPGRLRVVPHFIEPRRTTASYAEARRRLGWGAQRVVTLQGFLYPNKGHRLLVKALPELPPEVRVVFAGGPPTGLEVYEGEVRALAEAQGVAGRLHITGWLADDEMEYHLVASDLGVCPFSIISASSSLSSWIASGRPVLASDLPQMAEYEQWSLRAVRRFRPYEAGALAQAIRQTLLECDAADDPAVARLREALSMRLVFDRHLQEYCR
jgi:glycosyltransferase involved in cell wall biosynthesis